MTGPPSLGADLIETVKTDHLKLKRVRDFMCVLQEDLSDLIIPDESLKVVAI